MTPNQVHILRIIAWGILALILGLLALAADGQTGKATASIPFRLSTMNPTPSQFSAAAPRPASINHSTLKIERRPPCK